MPPIFLPPDDSTVESQDVPERIPWWRPRVPSRNLRTPFPWFTRNTAIELPDSSEELTSYQHPQDSQALSTEIIEQSSIPRSHVSGYRRFFGNLGAVLARFFALVTKPKRCVPPIVDFLLLLQSTWSGRQLGPDVVYPMLSITKRQSGRLANLILEHSRNEPSYELRARSESIQGIYSPCVVVIDLDDIPHHTYTVPLDFFGIVGVGILLHILGGLIMHIFYLWDQGLEELLGFWAAPVVVWPLMCVVIARVGDGNLTLVRRSGPPTSGSVVLLDQNFTVVLNGNRNVVEAIVESGFTHFDPDSDTQPSSAIVIWPSINFLSESAFIAILTLFCLAFRSLSDRWPYVAPLAITFISFFFPHSASVDSAAESVLVRLMRPLPAMLSVPLVIQPLGMVMYASLLFTLLHLVLAYVVSRGPNYPVQTAKLLDALGQPQFRKWEFNTLAKAATFQCLVICRGISRPIRSIDVAALLDLLVPDETPVWKAWKNRVADRIVYDTDIDFTPMVPTFPDKRQRQLKRLLDQAQSGYDAYQRFFDSQVW